MKSFFFVMLFLLFISNSQNAFSDYYNNRNVLIGERAAMMGGAYTALSEDMSGAFYNPAGLAFIDYDSISISAVVYNLQKASRESDIQTSSGSQTLKVEVDEIILIPSTFGVNYKLTDHIIVALIFLQTDKYRFNGSAIEQDSFIKVQAESDTFLMGPCVAFRLLDNLTIGVSLFFHYFQGKSNTFMDLPETTDRTIINAVSDVNSFGLTPVLGIKWHITPELKLGFMYGIETIHITGSNKYSVNMESTVYGDRWESGKKKGDVRLPHRMALGIAYEKKQTFTIAADIIYYFKMNYFSPNDIITPSHDDNHHIEIAHFDFSLGGEIYLADHLVLRLGLFTNTSGADKSRTSEKIHMYGVSLGVGFLKGHLSTGIGVVAMYGHSHKKMDLPAYYLGEQQVSWKRFSLGLVVGGTFLFGK